MECNRIGRRTVRLRRAPSVVSHACVGGKMERNGPLSAHFDELDDDPFFAQKTWELGESELQRRAVGHALEKGSLSAKDLDFLFAGDLLNQCIGSSFGLRDFGVPYFGIYGACSTMGEGLALGAMLIDGGFATLVGAVTSSHFCTAERQYRAPIPYGSQRTPTAQWTATAAGCCILGAQGQGPYVTHAVCGRMVDLGITDATNMGAAMAPAAIDTLEALFEDTHTRPQDYDLIITGDLGELGHKAVSELMERDGYDMRNYTDCGLLLYDRAGQDMHAGGSGAGCSAAVLNGYLLRGFREGRLHRIVFAPTGALLSPTSTFQGGSIPSICHAVVLSDRKEGA
ncbi:MAG: stage V sporulation protein AD [Oscillospiraceae bacterium]|nr:stage V sporulation protein AD [Oscillospiraceae bacterium]